MIQRQGAEHVEQRWDQQVVEQQHPAGDEADVGVDAALGVGVHRACDGEGAGHGAVAERGEEHRDHAHQIGHGDHAMGVRVDPAVNAEGGDGDHEDHAVDHKVAEGETTAELLFVSELFNSHEAIPLGAVALRVRRFCAELFLLSEPPGPRAG
ncbi:hypothetical protein D9M68_668150 [compost metagenome]